MGAHALGAAAYAAKAAGLAAPDRPEAVGEEIRWQLGHVSAPARAALRRLPPVGENPSGPLGPGLLASGLLGTIIRDLQAGLANTDERTRAMLERLYERFNARDIDAVLAHLADDVDWPNGWEGGYVRGHEGVRDYWTRQWAQIDSSVVPVAFSTQPDGRIDVTVHQVVRNLDGDVLDDSTVHHVYRLRDDRVEHMEIRR
jgi:ketosteroid isomerase-like protein